MTTSPYNFQIGDKVERTNGDARNRGVIIEIEGDRARINWTHRQRYTRSWDGRRDITTWTGEFTAMTDRAPRTWANMKFLKKVEA